MLTYLILITTLFSLNIIKIESINENSYKNGAYSLSWLDNKNSIDFTFNTSVSSTSNLWTSFAFSLDNQMGNDDVCICKIYGNNKVVERYFNSGKYRPGYLDPKNPTIGLSNINVSLNNGVLTCSFSRLKTMPGVLNYFDSSSKYFILNALGKTDDSGNFGYHSNRVSSSEPISFVAKQSLTTTATTSTTSTTLTTLTTLASIISIKNSSQSYLGEYQNGDFKLEWKNMPNSTQFIFKTNLTSLSNVWTSFAFSKDKNMGDDDAIICKLNGTNKSVERYFNMGKTRPVLLMSNVSTIGLSNINVSLNNNVLTCSFSRVKSMPFVNNYFDLRNKYFLLFAKGQIDDKGLKYHGENKASSNDLIDFQKSKLSLYTMSDLMYMIKDMISNIILNVNKSLRKFMNI